MEYIIEIILDLIVELGDKSTTSKKVPKAIRIIILCIITLLGLGVSGLFLLLGIELIQKTNLALGIVFIIFAILFLILVIKKTIKKVKQNK